MQSNYIVTMSGGVRVEEAMELLANRETMCNPISLLQ